MNNPDPQSEEKARFVQLVRDALAHLYDHAYLQMHPLAERLVSTKYIEIRTRAQELRRNLLDAIEELKPSVNTPLRAVERRPYTILFGLYVEGQPLNEVAASLSIGERQLRRDRDEAIQALASILWDRFQPGVKVEMLSEFQTNLQQESERLAQQREPVDLFELINDLQPLLDGIAKERDVSLDSHFSPGLPQPYTNRTLVRQALLSLSSKVLTSIPIAYLCFEPKIYQDSIGIGLHLKHLHRPSQTDGMVEFHTIQTLLSPLNGHILLEPLALNDEMIWVLLPLREEMVVLVVDDNRELFELFQRYVVGHPYRLVHASSVDQALSMIQPVSPSAVILDLMMPNRDGWEFLRSMKSNPDMKEIPVIVCSVLDETDLARSLGAQHCLKKPVVQVDLLEALRDLRAPAWGEAKNLKSPGRS